MARFTGKEGVDPLDTHNLRPNADLLGRTTILRAQLRIYSNYVLLTYRLMRQRESKLTARALADERANITSLGCAAIDSPLHGDTLRYGCGRNSQSRCVMYMAWTR